MPSYVRWGSIGRDKYERRSVIVCIVILVFVIATSFTAVGIYFGYKRSSGNPKNETQEGNSISVRSSALRRPNILFITLDDLRPTLGCFGDRVALTPNIDQLCERGFVFRNAYAQQALCAPSRTSFLTSRRPDSLHLYDANSYWRETVGSFKTLPQHLKDNGYHTASIGKIFHHGIASNKTDDYPYSWSKVPYHPPTQQYKMEKVCPSHDGQLHMNLVCPVSVPDQPGGSLPDLQNTAEAISFLKQYVQQGISAQPFFLGLGFYKPHIPLKFPKEYVGLYPLERIPLTPNRTRPTDLPNVAWNPWSDLRLREDIKALNLSFPYGPIPDTFQKYILQGYYSSVTYVDDLIGQLLEALDETGFSSNTAIILLGDHGWSLGEHQEWSKYSNFDVATKVPLIIVPPKQTLKPFKHLKASMLPVPSHQESYKYVDKLVELVDLFPTIAEMALVEIPNICPPQSQTKTLFCSEGRSLLPLLENADIANWKSAVFSQYPRPSAEPQENSDQPELKDIKIMGYSMKTKDTRYTEWIEFSTKSFTGNWSNVFAKELYFHNSDPGEMFNVADDPKYKNLVKQLSKQLRNGWRKA